MLYEYHNFKDDELKIIHHIDRLDKGNFFITHLHQNIELLLMRSGCADVSVDGETVRVESDELVSENAYIFKVVLLVFLKHV